MRDDRRAELRGAVARTDGVALVQSLSDKPWPDDALQLIGDGLQIALRQEIEEASGLARDCVAALRVRGWEGDEELADSLEARLGTAPTPTAEAARCRPRRAGDGT